jgi:hypothetical protein
MKKQKQKKTGAKKEEKLESSTDAPKESTAEPAAQEEEKEADPVEAPGTEETVADLPTITRDRQPSVSVQSKLRSSEFRQSSGGPLSPTYTFSPEGDTAPEIHRKQAVKIEELEKDNKRLAKEAGDAEKRWKKAEEELEDLREAEDEAGSGGRDVPSPSVGSSAELEKLVCYLGLILLHSILRVMAEIRIGLSSTPEHPASSPHYPSRFLPQRVSQLTPLGLRIRPRLQIRHHRIHGNRNIQPARPSSKAYIVL